MSIYHDDYSEGDKYGMLTEMPYTPSGSLEHLIALRDLLQKAIDNEDAKAVTLRQMIDLLKKEGVRLGDSEVKTMVQTAPLAKGERHTKSILDTYRRLLELTNLRIGKLAPLRAVNEAHDDDGTLDQIAELVQEPVEPIKTNMTLDLIDKAIEKAEATVAKARELHASFLHHYTWRSYGYFIDDKTGERRYPRKDQKLISKHRFDKITRAMRSLTANMDRRLELLHQLKTAVGEQAQ